MITVEDIRVIATALAKAAQNPDADVPEPIDKFVEKVVAAFTADQPQA